MATHTEYVPLRLSPAVLERVKEVTGHKDGQRSRALRIVIDAGLEAQNLEALRERIRSFDQLSEELALLRSDLSRVGGNLNQLAMLFSMDAFGDAELEQLAVAHRDIQSEFSELINVIKKSEGYLV
jgi:hypothetical protein